ncbi:MAG: protein-L-isoaspartate O-methyltransferase [bacterium]|nr:protein-L-isoaspartate O-methyltransferase [bacterium]
MSLIDELVRENWLKTARIIEAFRKIKRVDFLPEDSKDLAEVDTALSIGQGQTISQPLVVAFMIELLEPKEGDKILDVGSGSGWTSALLAEIVGEKGKVIALEVVPELKEFGEKNVAKYGFTKEGRVEFFCADATKGYSREAPFDKILASASGLRLPQPWKEQLRIGGKIVMPINSSIWLFEKEGDNQFKRKEYPGFVFVPLIEK